ncbi:MmcQ/YjbR family DNA-binding protein, partial [Streptomyces sp. NPDC056231]|uniref:MmcQ/YjbR family DNA-binding protein n=1 Tax=Streptomyces sp. NPDC056231 TaxID=3345755 RepID=UPI003AB06BDB
MTTADDVRMIALALPDTAEKLAWGQPTFRVAGKIFAALGDDDATMGVKTDRQMGGGVAGLGAHICRVVVNHHGSAMPQS